MVPILAGVFFSLSASFGASAAGTGGAGVRFDDSIKDVPFAAPGYRPHRVREVLTALELAENRDFVITLRMNNLGELQARIHSGGVVPRSEMKARYLPAKAEFDRVASWLSSKGFVLTIEDQNHVNLFVRGTVAQISDALGVRFARVAAGGGEFTSAVTAPTLPPEISGYVLSIDGLQPHLLMRSPKARPQSVTAVGGYFAPADIAAAYGIPAGINGSGQTIAIIMGAAPRGSDLDAFWQACGFSGARNPSIDVPVLGGPTVASQAQDATEVTLDAEWAMGMAPGAKLRIYEIPSLTTANILAACTQILADAANDPSIRVVSYSGAGLESEYSTSSLMADSQTFAQLAAAGITFLASSGDGGSNPNPPTEPNGYNPSNPLGVEYPASDPNSTSAGGTTLALGSNWNATGETAWMAGSLATGGGISGVFARPSWQAGSGVPSGSGRCVPDIAAVASANSPGSLNGGALIILNGQSFSEVGTSLSAPVWAGIVAIINQARSNIGSPPVGLLGPWLYPLIGTDAFQDITAGGNGAYGAGPGYDLCTGVGTPNVANLIARIDQASAAPAISSQPSSQTINSGGSVAFAVTAAGFPVPGYQWRLNGAPIAGATSSRLVISGAGAANAGSYTCVVVNSSGTTISDPATLSVSSTKDIGRMVNFSTLAPVGINQILTVGFFTGGAGTQGTQNLLVRALGPALAGMGVTGELTDPTLTLFSGTGAIGFNDNWASSAANEASVTAADSAVYAFPLTDPKSLDSALVTTLAAGGYTAQVSGNAGTSGSVLTEVYDDTPSGAYTPATPRLTNISCKTQIGAGGSLTAGFVIGGSTSRTVLVRATGPALAAFGVAGFMPDPQLALHASVNGVDTVLDSNAGWGGDPQITAVSNAVFAFPLTDPASHDAVVLATLAPGSYTAVASSVGGTAGVVMIEVYEVP
ncbi:MAG: protease pro-enzyme activation domain-containing protein [Opitutaceae bacterium]|jgi:kumamolisin